MQDLSSWIVKKCGFLFFIFLLKINHWKVYNIQNSKLCFVEMKMMTLRNYGDTHNNLPACHSEMVVILFSILYRDPPLVQIAL